MRVLVITGSTCSGKSEAAMKFALANNAEIVSCDSVQVYRYVDIGSAKPTPEEQAAVRHHLIDVAEPHERFDVAQYADLARQAINDIRARGKNAVVCGGSGFYLKAWFAPVTDNVYIPEDIKILTEKIEREGGAQALAKALLNVDSDAASCVDLMNPRRTKNALERCLASGKSARTLREEFSRLPSPIGDFPKELVLLDRPDLELQERIAMRSRTMVECGLIEETRALLERGIEKNPSLAASVGYKETIAWIANGETNKEKLVDEISTNTFSLARKQRKYFRTFLPADYPRRNFV